MSHETPVLIPDPYWPVDEEYAEYYQEGVERGRRIAGETTVSIVAIARNSMPALPNTMILAAHVGGNFKRHKMFVFENDSTDETAKLLDALAGESLEVRHESLGGSDTRGFEDGRTERLAYCRNQCLQWVRDNDQDSDWTIVLDTDPAGGFSPDGVFNSIARLSERPAAGGMASYSLWRHEQQLAHYDAWAARPPCWWRDRREEIGMAWFSSFLPPVGSPPCPMNSAFGGLAVYRTKAFLAGGYSGGDCEHVSHHKRMRDVGWEMFLNPGSRYIAYWQE